MGFQNIYGLTPGKTYLFQVRAWDSRGNPGPWSDVHEFTAQTEDSPLAPTNIYIDPDLKVRKGKIYKVTLSVAWTAPNKSAGGKPINIAYYDIDFESDDGMGGYEWEQSIQADKGATSAKWTDATPDLSYRVRVRAVSVGGTVGNWSAYAVTSGLKDETAPPVPTGLTVKQSGRTIHAKVDKIAATSYPDFDGFQFYAANSSATVALADSSQIVSHGKLRTQSFKIVWDTTANAIRDIRIDDTVWVVAKSYDKEENFSAACTAVSVISGGATISAPTNLAVTSYGWDEESAAKNDTFIEFEWNRGQDADGNYCASQMQMKKTALANYGKTYYLDDPGTGTKVYNWVGSLKASTTWDWRVRYVSQDQKKSAWTTTGPVSTTGFSALGAPSNFAVSAHGDHFDFTWKNLTGAQVGSYILYASCSSGGTYTTLGKATYPTNKLVIPVGEYTSS